MKYLRPHVIKKAAFNFQFIIHFQYIIKNELLFSHFFINLYNNVLSLLELKFSCLK